MVYDRVMGVIHTSFTIGSAAFHYIPTIRVTSEFPSHFDCIRFLKTILVQLVRMFRFLFLAIINEIFFEKITLVLDRKGLNRLGFDNIDFVENKRHIQFGL